MARVHEARKHTSLDRTVWSQPGIGLEVSEIRQRNDSKLGSTVLYDACMDLFQRTANRLHVNMEEAMARHLGMHSAPALPGTENVIRGQRAQRQLAA